MNSTAAQTITRGQAQRILSQKIQKLYKNQIGHSPEKVTCQIIDNKVMVIAENSLTKVERLLIAGEEDELKNIQIDAEQVRSNLDAAIKPALIDIFQETLSATVVDILSDTTLETSRTAIVAILSNIPEFTKANV